MNRLPDIIVLDFCIWLHEKLRLDLLDLEECVADDFFLYYLMWKNLTGYAQEYLSKCPIPIRSEDLANSTLSYLLKTRQTDTLLKTLQTDTLLKTPQTDTLYCSYGMINYDVADMDVADVIDFLEWTIKKEQGNPSFENMPPEVFEVLLEEYIRDNKKSSEDYKKLKNDYYREGWSSLFRKIQNWCGFEGKYIKKSLSDIMDRYLCKRAKFNCIILPLADKRNREVFRSLVHDQWKNLNELSGDDLDIYYSETDIGKTGYDIAARLRSLPNELKKNAPSLIIWKYDITKAKAIPIRGLNIEQIYTIIETIVNQIGEGKELDSIIEEATKEMKKLKEENHGVTHITNNTYYDNHGDNVQQLNGTQVNDNASFTAMQNNNDINADKLHELIEAMKSELNPNLSSEDKADAEESIDIIEAELKSGNPDEQKVKSQFKLLKRLDVGVKFASACCSLLTFADKMFPFLAEVAPFYQNLIK